MLARPTTTIQASCPRGVSVFMSLIALHDSWAALRAILADKQTRLSQWSILVKSGLCASPRASSVQPDCPYPVEGTAPQERPKETLPSPTPRRLLFELSMAHGVSKGLVWLGSHPVGLCSIMVTIFRAEAE